ncbi:response regulator [Sphingomonas histidinilytica]|jgi:two-component system OmpR family response regulator|uniref:Two-component system, OmpR family, response regulator n=1 Tax=Rhizorhabdus histidinilytica TaxID=439228 RepID=A0A1T5CMH9_9SPHN|nr:response regulator transcription factor [Rhizorhabdus histidinilytica]MBO9380554.1 response regulator [Rhizorhabdus histidinilytica]QEH78928.1 response regulator transcription factor [Sphingomonas sp. C8-2]SKB60360.1 two-component system, OmpR family, response regulator [Rhizorhabdus histidinilytica]
MHVLLIEDDPRVADHVGKGLCEAGHIVESAADGREGLLRAAAESFDVIVLDRMLPQVDGLKILQTIRATGDTTPVLILSALGDVDERIRGLRAGGDDYLPKPFALSELVARVEALGRRGPAIAEATELRSGDLAIDLLGRTVTRAGRRIDLTQREFRILEYLVRNAGRVVTRSMLLEHVWDYNFDPQTNIIDQHVSRLRQKLDRGFDTPLIETVRGTGYVVRPAA